MIESPEHLQIFVACEVLIDGGVLAGEADARPQRVSIPDNIEASYLRSPGVGTEQRRQDAHSGSLAGAIGAEHREDATLLGAEIQPGQGARLPILFFKSFGQNSRFIPHTLFFLITVIKQLHFIIVPLHVIDLHAAICYTYVDRCPYPYCSGQLSTCQEGMNNERRCL